MYRRKSKTWFLAFVATLGAVFAPTEAAPRRWSSVGRWSQVPLEPRQLSADQIASFTVASSVLITGIDAPGKSIPIASGFLIAPRIVVTSYAAIRNAAQIKAKVGSHQAELVTVVAVSRDRVVALLRLSGDRGVTLGRPYRHPLALGDTVYSIANDPRIPGGPLAAAQIVGRSWPAPAYLTVSPAFSPSYNGAAVVSHWGELIGLAGPADDGRISRIYSITKIASLYVEIGMVPKKAVVTEEESTDLPENSSPKNNPEPTEGGPPVGVRSAAAGAEGHTSPIRQADSVIAGMALRRAEPMYPVLAQPAKLSGSVVVEVIIDEHGYVTSENAISGDDRLSGPAVAAARGWLFKPTTIGGSPVKVLGQITFNFKL